MQHRTPRSLALALAPFLLAMGNGTSAPAEAPSATEGQCLEVTLYYWTPGGPDEYVIGPDHCVLGTPWPAEQTFSDEVPVAELDSGVGYRIQIPLPEHP